MKISTRKASEAIAKRMDFDTHGALKGFATSPTTGPYTPTGRLNAEETGQFYADLPWIDYVVYSYGTPICWHKSSGWYRVSQKFSVTTSKHMGQCPLTGTR